MEYASNDPNVVHLPERSDANPPTGENSQRDKPHSTANFSFQPIDKEDSMARHYDYCQRRSCEVAVVLLVERVEGHFSRI